MSQGRSFKDLLNASTLRIKNQRAPERHSSHDPNSTEGTSAQVFTTATTCTICLVDGLETISDRYLIRLRFTYEAGTRVVSVGSRHTVSDDLAIVGWSSLPDASTLRLPNPWDDIELTTAAEALCWETTAQVLEAIAPALTSIAIETGATVSSLSLDYWDWLLRPWLIHMTSMVLDAWLLAQATIHISGELTCCDVDVHTPPNDFAQSLQLLQGTAGEHQVKRLIAEYSGTTVNLVPQSEFVPLVTHSPKSEARRVSTLQMALHALQNPQAALRHVQNHIGNKFEERPAHECEIAMIGQTGFTAADQRQLRQHVPQLRWIHSDLRARPNVPMNKSLRQVFQEPETAQPLTGAVISVLAATLPISVVEGLGLTQAWSLEWAPDPYDTIIHGYGCHELQNDYLARCAGSGRSIKFAQHGGFYLQSVVNAQERLEIRRDSLFASWGNVREENVLPVATPRLERLRQSHRGGSNILLIEPLMPAVPQTHRFLGGPIGDQTFKMSNHLDEFVELMGNHHSGLRLRRFPGSDHANRSKRLADLPVADAMKLSTWHMQRSKCTVMTYLDTPIIEALVIDVPTIVIIDLERWHFRPDCQVVINLLIKTRIIHANPSSAANHIRALSDVSLKKWWEEEQTRHARHAFLNRFARRGDWLSEWRAFVEPLETIDGTRR